MTRVRGRPGPPPWLAVLGATSLAAWGALLVGDLEPMPPALCSPYALRGAPQPASLDLVLLVTGPAQAACSALLMVAAMMLPLVVAPLQHVHDRSFARRRGRAMLLFLAGYTAVWVCTALGLQAGAAAARWAAPTPLACFVLAAAAALLWQTSPAKQWCLNRCHRRPRLAAFNAAADRDAFAFGLTNGLSCAGGCWALMLVPLSAANLHLLAMAVVALFVFVERFERPAPLAWRHRLPRKAVRIAVKQLRQYLAVRTNI